ncbi:MAG: transcriptional regulator NrdR [Arenicellales bacterium]|jgi:transcriptional repressor NrdR|nr:transcriptional regulator NrdR [Arenicellales bacterium]|tara:strand:- start:169 stop:684 length:516 start_codon:yes stop_codon:yes gene_type:complete
MRCPACSNEDTRVVDSRISNAGATVRRRRECQGCSHRFTTFERFELEQPRVIKSDGRREPWDEEKLRRGLLRALEKRPVGSDKVEALINAVSRQMQLSGEPEVRSALIGQAMMDRLQRTDEIAYVRYASVYRSFEDVSAFSKEVDRLRREKGAASNVTQLSLLVEKVSEEK